MSYITYPCGLDYGEETPPPPESLGRGLSVIITSIKQPIKTLDCLPKELVNEVIISDKRGLGYARNYGALRSIGELLVFLDDDLKLDSKVWDYILQTKYGSFSMTFQAGFPCTRVLAIHRKDFFSIGGFDDKIKFTGEDRDFYVRALDAGLKFNEIPLSLVYHFPHRVRAKNVHVALQSVKENVVFMRRYWRRHPEVFSVDFLAKVKRGQLRTLLIWVFWFFYLSVKQHE